MEKLGVVMFSSGYYTDEGLAALQWASVLTLSKVQILLVEQQPNNNQQIDKTEKFNKNGLIGAVRKGGENNDWFQKFKGFINALKPQEDIPIYKGPDIKKILEEAIDDFNLHTLVLGMRAAGSSTPPSNSDVNSGGSTPPSNSDVNSGGPTHTSNIDLIKQLNSKCSVVLAKIDQSTEVTIVVNP